MSNTDTTAAVSANTSYYAARNERDVEDVEWLLKQGVDPWWIPAKVGASSAAALRLRLKRAGRPDLAGKIAGPPAWAA